MTPTNGTPNNGRARSKGGMAHPAQTISSLVSNTHSQNGPFQKSRKDHKPMLGTLPTSSTNSNGKKQSQHTQPTEDMSQDVNRKVSK